MTEKKTNLMVRNIIRKWTTLKTNKGVPKHYILLSDDLDNLAIELVKKLNIDDVSKQRELLIAWETKNQLFEYGSYDRATTEDIDEFLSNL